MTSRSIPAPLPVKRLAYRILSHIWPTRYPVVRSRPALQGIQLCVVGDVKIMLDSATPAHVLMYREGTLEPELTRIIALLARPNDVFVDIGANVGWHSLSLLRHRPDVRMSYAFEPARRTFEMLEAGVTANGLAARCKIRQCAIGQHETSMRLKSFASFGSTHSSMYPLADWPYTEEDVPVFSLDMLARDFVSLPSLIKCDVEGAERDVLLGASELMSGRAGPPPIWLLEANYETSGMAGFFPYQLLELAAARATYEGFIIREGRVVPLPSPTSLRHGDTLILAVPAVHRERLAAAG